jgi:hypothetical protein
VWENISNFWLELQKEIEIDRSKLFRRNCKIWRNVIMKNVVILEYSGHKNVAIQKNLWIFLHYEGK